MITQHKPENSRRIAAVAHIIDHLRLLPFGWRRSLNLDMPFKDLPDDLRGAVLDAEYLEKRVDLVDAPDGAIAAALKNRRSIDH